MFKKIAVVLVLAFSLAATAGAMSPSQQFPIPPPNGGGNIVLQFPIPPPNGGGNIVLQFPVPPPNGGGNIVLQ